MSAAALAAACGTQPASDRGTWVVDRTTTDGAILGVWGSGPSDVWAVGGQADRSLVLHGDGSGFTRIDVSSRALLYGVYGITASDVYAVGEHGLILHYDGATWSQVASGTQLPLFGLWGGSSDDVWIVGGDMAGPPGSAVVLRGSRGGFHAVAMPADVTPNVLFKAHGFAADDVTMVGAGGAVLRWDGTAWHRDAVPTEQPLRSTWGSDPENAYAVGGDDTGEILHSDGQEWRQVAELHTGEGLNGVFTSADGSMIAVGPHGVFELDAGTSLVEAALPAQASAYALHGVWGDDAGTTYAVGGTLDAYPGAMGGVILRRR
jgi:hypothetical protein